MLPPLTARRRVELSRRSPDFAPPGRTLGQPLDDPHLSRTPITLAGRSDGGVCVVRNGCTTSIEVGGQRLTDRVDLTAAQVAAGVDLVLADSVALLLHVVSVGDSPLPPGFGLVGESDRIHEIRHAVDRVADLEVPVLLRGESGTGKELVARAIHDHGLRRTGPFVGVNLSAVTPTLAAAELFGTVKGAFTGAVARRGFFRAADGGTLFLDELGECPPDVQTMLLRALETSEFYPVGAHSPQTADARLIAATDSDLESRARAGAFKEPLLHRLAAYEIWLPPLRERRDDIGRLIVHFALEARQRTGDPPPPEDWIPAGLVARMVRHPWPGNVRELRNLIWQLVIDHRGQPRLASNPRLERLLAAPAAPDVAPGREARRPADIPEAEVRQTLAENRWDVASAARQLGISRPSLYELIRRSSTLRTAQDLGKEAIDQALEDAGGDLDRAAERLEVSARGLSRRLSQLAGEDP